jgi:4-methyl-5(b-hydroxyethyl)-thiazole monophosphate biosynthesis
MMSQKIVVPLAKGFEEIEAVALIDVMRRAGLEVVVAGVDGENIEGANKMTLKADTKIDTILADDFDMIVLPGGFGGTEILASDVRVQNLIKAMKARDKMIGAICAAPIALDKAGVLEGRYTCYPSVEEHIGSKNYTADEKVVISGNVMTSRGPGTAICFGLAIVKKLCGVETYNALKEGLLANYC